MGSRASDNYTLELEERKKKRDSATRGERKEAKRAGGAENIESAVRQGRS